MSNTTPVAERIDMVLAHLDVVGQRDKVSGQHASDRRPVGHRQGVRPGRVPR